MNTISLLGCALITFHICICENIVFRNDKPPKPGFGEYVLALQKLDDCGEKIEDEILAEDLKLHHVSHSSDSDDFIVTMNLRKIHKITRMIVSINIWKNEKFTKVIERNVSNPCTNYIGKKLLILEGILNESKCILNTGNFSSPVIRPDELGHQLLGQKFFYGLARGSIKFYGEKGLGFCIQPYIIIKPNT